MKKDDFITEVIFRNNQIGDIFALFPYVIATLAGDCMSYEHIGQHSNADYNYCISKSVPAKENEYADLKSELESIGYNLKVVKRRNYDRYLKELNKVRNL